MKVFQAKKNSVKVFEYWKEESSLYRGVPREIKIILGKKIKKRANLSFHYLMGGTE